MKCRLCTKQIRWVLALLLPVTMFSVKATAQTNKNLTALIRAGSVKFPHEQLRDTLQFEQTAEWIILKVKVNGELRKFIWDTGSAYSGIDQTDNSNFRKIDGAEVNFTDAVGAKQKSSLYTSKSVLIGSTEFRDITFMPLDTRTIAAGVLKDYAGIIGLDIIDKVNWSFDVDKNLIVISSIPFEKGNGKEVRYANYLSYNTMRVNMDLSNGKHINTALLIDFGAAGNSIYLSGEHLSKLKTMKAEFTEGVQGVGISGIGAVQKTYKLVEPIACTFGISGRNIALESKVTISSNNEQSVIGNHFFRQFNFVRNSSQSVFIFFDRQGKTAEESHSTLSYGISLGINEKKEIYITGLTKNPNLYDGKLKIGQVLQSLNGKDAAAFHDMIDLKNYLTKCITDNSSLKITTSSGAEFNLYPKNNEVVKIG